MITSKSSSQHPKRCFKLRRNTNCAYRKSVSHSLSHGINICFYPCVIMRIKIAGTSITALYSVGNKYGSILIAKCTNRLKKRNRSLSYPTHALYSLDNYSTNLITKILESSLYRLLIIKRQKDHVFCLINRSYNCWVIRNCHCQGCT